MARKRRGRKGQAPAPPEAAARDNHSPQRLRLVKEQGVRQRSALAGGGATTARLNQSPLRRLLDPASLPSLALLGMVALAYWQAFFAGFVWDDNKFILEEAAVREWGGFLDIWLNPRALTESHYWPLLYSGFWLEHKLWGFAPAGYHAVNVLLHGVNSALLWRLLARLQVPGAWLIAAVFALHPVHVEAVAWVIARKDLLATLFYLLAVAAWLRFREASASGSLQGRFAPAAGASAGASQLRAPRAAAGKGRRDGWLRSGVGAYAALILLYAAGVLSKTVAITLPAALLVLVWWQEGRIGGRALAQTTPLFLMGLALGAYGLGLYAEGGVAAVDHSLAERVIIAAKSLWFYAGKLLWPEPLLFIYPLWDTNPAAPMNWLPVLGALALAAGLWLARHRLGRGALAGALFFAITLAPTLGFLPFRYMQFAYAADRYQYLAMAGLIAVLVAGAALALRRLATITPPAEGEFANATSVGGGGATYAASPSNRPWTRLLAWVGGRSALGNASRGENERFVEGPPNANRFAIGELPASLQAAGAGGVMQGVGCALTIVVLCVYGALSFERAGLFQDQVRLFRHVIATNPAARESGHILGTFLMERGQWEEAAAAYRRALEWEPLAVKIHANLGSVLMQLERHEEAVAVMRQGAAQEAAVLATRPDRAVARHETAAVRINLGLALLKLGRLAEAEKTLRLALGLQPSSLEARQNLALVLDHQAVAQFQAGGYGQAVRLFRESIALAPGNAETHANLGSALGQLRRYREAKAAFEQALVLDPGNEAARVSLQAVSRELKE